MPNYPVANADLHTSVGPAGSHFERAIELGRLGPVYWNEEAQGYWVLTNFEDILAVGADTSTFTNESIVAVDPDPAYRILPSNAEPPLLRHLRGPVSTYLSPKRVERYREQLRDIANELLDEFGTGDGVDFVKTFGNHFPARMFCLVMGLPKEDSPFFLSRIHRISQVMFEGRDPTDFVEAMNDIRNYFRELLSRRDDPRDVDTDFASMLLSSSINGRPISDDEFLDMCMTVTLGSHETSRDVLGWFFWHMATHESDRRWIVEDPSIIPSALEEILRSYTIFSSARKLSKDTELRGCPMKKGDMALLHYTAANHDPERFENPNEVILDRSPNDHLSFGKSAHRCLGLHLARVEMQVFIEEWHKRIPEYKLAADDLKAHGGQIALFSLPLTWSSADLEKKA